LILNPYRQKVYNIIIQEKPFDNIELLGDNAVQRMRTPHFVFLLGQ